MINFEVGRRGVVMEYEPTLADRGWVRRELRAGQVRIAKTFIFQAEDLIDGPAEEEPDILEDDGPTAYRFRLARTGRRYHRIAGRKLGLDHDVLIAREGIDWRRDLFVAERGISVFARVARIMRPGAKIVIGGEREDAIPVDAFEELISRFPTTYEMDRYAEARVAAAIGDFVDPRRDFRERYETYLNRRARAVRRPPLEAPELVQGEIEKFELLHSTLTAWLASDDRSEREWQEKLVGFLLLLFPKYVAVLEDVPIADHYTTPGRTRSRRIDLALVDVAGNVDVVEIKRPSQGVLLRRTPYRDNHVPTATLSGTIMQGEKYLFHLSKGGRAAEVAITERYRHLLPAGLEIRITNPRALLVLGRDTGADGAPVFDRGQAADLEIVKRKYANVMDIVTYDDLLRRLERILASLRRRKEEGL